MGKRGPQPTDTATLKRRGSWRAKAREKAEKLASAPRPKLPKAEWEDIRPGKLRALIRQIPGYDPFRDAKGCEFKPELANKVLRFFHTRLRHIEGAVCGQPFRLEPWQQAVLANLFGWVKKDAAGRTVRRYRESLIYVPRKNGKMLALDTPLPTPDGWTTMGEVQAGDVLFDERGNSCRVAVVHEIDQQPESYLMRFSNGEEIKACADHLWVTTARVDMVGAGCGRRQKALTGQPRGTKLAAMTRERSTKEIFETQRFGERADINHSLRMPGPIQTQTDEFEYLKRIPPYVLGAWLGDGDSDCGRITCSEDDKELIKYVSDEWSKEIDDWCWGPKLSRDKRSNAVRFGLPWLKSALKMYDVLGNKHIPACYLRSCVADRLSLLQGLLDTDGTISKSGRVIQYVTISKALSDGVGELLASLGIKYSVRTKYPRCNGKQTDKLCYMLQFVAFRDELPVFRLSRKLARMKLRSECRISPRSRTVQIISVEKCHPVPMRCITVDSPSGQYLCGRTMIPTHNTPWMAGLALYVLLEDAEQGQQNYLAAESREQAGKLFRYARLMVNHSDTLQGQCRVYGGTAQAGQSKSIVKLPEESSFLQVVAADAEAQHGGTSHLVIVDELHAQPNRDLIDVFQTSLASNNRAQPLIVYITTADFQRESICNEKYDYACNVRDGVLPDAAFLPVIFEAKDGDDWTDPKTWARCNPNLGVSVSLDHLERECKRAEETPTYENTFKRLHLNIRTEQDVRWLSIAKWDECGADFGFEALEGRECIGGLDLASKGDITALIWIGKPKFEGDKWIIFPRFWVPNDGAVLRERRDRVPYLTWGRQGHINLTGDARTDYVAVRNQMIEDIKRLNVAKESIAADPWNLEAFRQEVDPNSQYIMECPQSIGNFTAPTKELSSLVASGMIQHNRNPVLRWMAGNVVVHEDNNENIRPVKKKATERIDGIVATIMALGLAMKKQIKISVYESRGVLQL